MTNEDLNIESITNTVTISSMNEITPTAVRKWLDNGIKIIIVADTSTAGSIVERRSFRLSTAVTMLETYVDDMPIYDVKDNKFHKEQHKYAQRNHSKINYKRR